MFMGSITPMIITFNEAPNIGRTLDKLTWADRLLIIDSGSFDDTLAIIARYGRAQVVRRAFDDFASQCNFGLSLVETPWVLSLDADYELSDEFVAELTSLEPGDAISGYRANFVYRVAGLPLRGTLYPARAVLYRRERASYSNEGHGHRVKIKGTVAELTGKIFHDDRKPLSRWFASQQHYAKLEAEHLLSTPPSAMRMTDRIRAMAWPAPVIIFFYTMIAKGCILDGWPGWLYVLQRTLAEILIAMEVVERVLRTREQLALLKDRLK
jgi:glycosyltransferase involved in cell wall biosynthesis